MGCCGDREKAIAVTEEQKWDYITLSDFKSTNCLTPLSYVWLWVLIITSVAVYAADAFTAVNLLAFDKWNSEVQPPVSFDIVKWIFAICIIVSYVFLAYRWFRALRVIRSGSVTECYLEPLAAIFQSMRLTKSGQGWRRFLVFAELTRSRQGVDYLALFTYFQFKGALLIIVAQGPRMAINAMTLWAVMQAQLIPEGEHAGDNSPFVQFFVNIGEMTKEGNKQEVVIYFTMLFSLVIWAIAALSLLLSGIFWVFFLWHYVPSSDGSLTNYCRRKIETRLERIVSKKVRKAIEKQDKKRRKEEELAIKKGESVGQRAPTLPKLGGDEDTSSVYSMNTVTTLPPYSTNGPTRSNTSSTNATTRTPLSAMTPSLPSLRERPSINRSDTSFSTASYATNAPLLSQAGSMGMTSPQDPMPNRSDYFGEGAGPRPMPRGPERSYTPTSQGRATPQQRMPLPPVNTSYNDGRVSPPQQLVSPLPNDPRGRGPHVVDPTFSPYDNRGASGPAYELSPVEATDDVPQYYFSHNNGSNHYRPQLPSSLRSGSPVQPLVQHQNMSNNNFASGPPSRAGTAPPNNPRAGLPASLQSAIQRREASQPLPNRGPNGYAQQQRSATAPIQQPAWAQGPTRSNTSTPGGGYGGGYNPY